MPLLWYRDTFPKLRPDVLLAPGAMVIGDVEIGEKSSIWFGTIVRGDVFHIRIGNMTNIQDNSVVHVTTDRHPTILGDGVTVGHRVMLHGCTVEDHALIGMGAIVMDRAVIGRGAIVGAGAIVTEGMKVPPNTLVVGAPARPRRTLTPEEQAHLVYSYEHYVDVAGEYLARYGNGQETLPDAPTSSGSR